MRRTRRIAATPPLMAAGPPSDEELGRLGVPMKPFRLGGWLDIVTNQYSGWSVMLEARGLLCLYPDRADEPFRLNLVGMPPGSWIRARCGERLLPFAVFRSHTNDFFGQWLPPSEPGAPRPPASADSREAYRAATGAMNRRGTMRYGR